MRATADTDEHLQHVVAALRRYDLRMKGLGRLASTRSPGASPTTTASPANVSSASGASDSSALSSRLSSRLSNWHWHREVMLPTSLGTLPASLFEDAAVRLALAEPALMRAGLVARALYVRRSAVRRCIDRTSLTQLRVALGDGAVGHERLQRLQRLTAVDSDLPVPVPVPLPELLTPMHLAHDGLSRLRRAHVKMVPVVVHFVLMQLDAAPLPGPEDTEHAAEATAFFEHLPHLIPELS